MNIRLALPEDLDAVMSILREAQTTIAALGVDQWQNGYPDRETVARDIAAKRSVLIEDGGEIAATFALCGGEEPTYRVIRDGAWLTGDDNRRYLTLHRVAIAVSRRGTGLAGEIVRYAQDCARREDLISLRADTHEGNAPMRRMLAKHGFVPCGVIRLANGDPRVAYEKIIQPEESA